MFKKIVFFLIFCSVPVLANSGDLELRNDHPEEYVVKRGDTLWDISGVFLKKPWYWPEIWQINPQIANPHLIYPGDVLVLSDCHGKPCLKRKSGGRNVKLSPRIRSTSNMNAIPPIPLDVIRPFLSQPRFIANQKTFDEAPYILSSQDEHLIAGMNHQVYVRGIDDNDARNRYMVFRNSKVYRDAPVGKQKQGEILGYEALYIGDAKMLRFGDPATALITQSEREVLVGDSLFPEDEQVDEHFIPHAPTHDINGKIISVIDGVSQIGQYQIVVLNLGSEAGLEAGHVLSIHESGRLVRDTFGHEKAVKKKRSHKLETIELPEERIGELMVFRTFDKVSYALVMDLMRPAHIYDSVHRP